MGFIPKDVNVEGYVAGSASSSFVPFPYSCSLAYDQETLNYTYSFNFNPPPGTCTDYGHLYYSHDILEYTGTGYETGRCGGSFPVSAYKIENPL